MIMKWSYILIESLLFKKKIGRMFYNPWITWFSSLKNHQGTFLPTFWIEIMTQFFNHFGCLNLTVFHIVPKLWHTKYPESFFKAWLTASLGSEQGMFPVQSEHAIELKQSLLLTGQVLAIVFIKRNKAYQLKW